MDREDLQNGKPFRRSIKDDTLDRLIAHELFSSRLRDDITRPRDVARACSNRVFPAVRQDRVDFYHQGGKLFSFDRNGFSTHMKYGTGGSDRESSTTQIAEGDLPYISRLDSFVGGYGGIKSLCALYAGAEAKGVAGLYGRFSFVLRADHVVVLDIEASFDAAVTADGDTENEQDRIDLVLMDAKDGTIMFVEAKRYVNPEIWAAKGDVPPVSAQIARYRRQVRAQHVRIKEAYRRYLLAMSKLVPLDLPEPGDVIPEVPLLIFGYEGAQVDDLNKCKAVLNGNGVCCLNRQDFSMTGDTLCKWFEQTRRWCEHKQ